jgi:hypothetical protein
VGGRAHATRRNARPRHIARLFITDVPGDVTARDLTRALTRAGRQFGEGGIPWANHYVAPRAAWRDEVEGAWNRGDVACIAYAELAADAARIAVTLRLPRDLHARLQRVAQQRGVPAHTVIIEAVDGYVAVQEHMLGRREDDNGEQR